MKALVLMLIVTGCQSVNSESPSRMPVEALQATSVGQGLQLHRFDVQEIRRRYAGQNSFEQIMQALSEERWDLVIQQAEKHLQEHVQGDEDAFLFSAIAYAAKGQIDRAQFYAELVLKGRPRQAMALNLLGVLQRQRAARARATAEADGRRARGALRRTNGARRAARRDRPPARAREHRDRRA